MVRTPRDLHPKGVHTPKNQISSFQNEAFLPRAFLAFASDSDPPLTKPLLPRLRRPFTAPTTSTWHRSFDGRLRLCESAGDVSRSTLLHKLAPNAASKSARLGLAGSRRLLRPAPKRRRVDDSFWPLHIHGSRIETMTQVDTRRVCEA